MEYKKIEKRQARTLYNKGIKIYLLPCKVRFFNNWIGVCEIEKNERDFDSVVNEYSFYNCKYNELGLYPAYYIEV